MDCREAEDYLPELDGDRLPADVEHRLRAHLTSCPRCGEAAAAAAGLRALLRAEAPRYTAPPALRRRVGQILQEAEPAPSWWARFRGRAWLVPSLAGVAAVVLALWGGSRWLAPDPVSTMLAQAVVEHEEYVHETMPRQAPDPQGLLTSLAGMVAFPVEPVFRGDAQVQLIATMTSHLRGETVAALIYRNAAGVYSTLFLMPQDVPIPAQNRLAIQAYKPHHRVADGRHILLWKQHGLTHLLVTDVGEAELPGMFLKIRNAA